MIPSHSKALAAGLAVVLLAASAMRARPTIAVAPVILHNMSANPDTHEDSSAIVQLTEQARIRLAACGYSVTPGSAPSLTADHPGATYLWEHPDVVAEWGAAVHADWVLVSRLNRIGPWIAEWEVQVVSTKSKSVVNTRVIEIKGISRDTALTAHMTVRGAAWFVDQVTQSIAHATADTAAAGRPCHA